MPAEQALHRKLRRTADPLPRPSSFRKLKQLFSKPPRSPPPQLDEQIVARILQNFVEPGAADIQAWKDYLPLMAVCRQWRNLLLPQVYSQVFVELKRPLSSETSPADSYCTNAGAIAANQGTHLVSSIKISILQQMTTMEYGRTLAMALGLPHQCWERAHTAEVKLCYNYGTEENSGEMQPPPVILARGLPSIQTIHISSDAYHGEVCNSFIDSLVAAFNHQLRGFSTYVPVTLSKPQFANNLTSLRMSMKPLSIEFFAKIHAEPLEGLWLSDVPVSFGWSNFVATTDPHRPVFGRLRQLGMEYETFRGGLSSADTQTEIQPFFPGLEKLRLVNSPLGNVLLKASTFGQQLVSFKMEYPTSIGTLVSLREAAPSQQLSVVLPASANPDPGRYYQAANYLFDQDNRFAAIGFIIPAQGTLPDPHQIKWSGLHSLAIHTPVAADMLLELLKHTPTLTRLQATALISTPVQNAAYVTYNPNNYSGYPFVAHSGIQHLTLRHHVPSIAQEDVSIIVFIIASIPSLQVLSTTRPVLEILENQVARYYREYPHLAKVVYSTTK